MKEKFLTKTWVVFLGAFVCCSLWGSAFSCVKIGYRLFAISSDAANAQILFAGIRFMFAGIMVIVFGSIQNKKLLLPHKESIKNIMILAMLQTTIQYLFFYIGLANTTGVKASIIVSVNTFIAILLSSLVFHQEKLNITKMIGCLFGFAGVVLINVTGNGISGSFNFLGDGFILLSAISAAASSVCIKKYSQRENPVILSGYQFFIGGIIMIIIGILMGGKISQISAKGVCMLTYLVFISAVAYTLWGTLLKYNPVSRVTVFGFMNPTIGVIISAIVLNEKEQAFGVTNITSLLLVCIGIWIVNYLQVEK